MVSPRLQTSYRHEGVETALVYGIVNGDVVDGSSDK